MAWLVTVMISTAPAIFSMQFTGTTPGWLAPAQIGVAAAFLLVCILWPTLRSLRRFAVAMIAFLLLLQVRPRIDLTWMPRQSLFGATAFDSRMQAEQAGKLLVAMLMIGVLLLVGYRRRDFFLAVGDVTAPIGPVRLLGFPHADPWWRFGLQWSLYIAAALAVAFYLIGRPTTGALAGVVPMLPSILFYAAVNAFSEEMTYRAPMLATLEPGVGSTHALWQSATFFGVAHYFGTPGGLLGAALAIFMGWILGKAMIETRGLFWSWWIHFLSDAVIFGFLAADLVR